MVNYDREPFIEVNGHAGEAWQGYELIGQALQKEINQRYQKCQKQIVVIDCYPGTDESEILEGLSPYITSDSLTLTRPLMKTPEDIDLFFSKNITEDRVFGFMSHSGLDDFFDVDKLGAARDKIMKSEGIHLICGVGASLVTQGDILIYADLARWEIQRRYRAGEVGNLGAENAGEDILRLYKRGYFVDWRAADRHKRDLFHRVDFFLDTNKNQAPAMAAGNAVRTGMAQTVARPFRVVPYFDAGVWGGQWMRDKFGLPDNGSNYAWCFDCVPEENSLILCIDGIKLEFPAIDLVFFWPEELLGERVYARFGAEFPIRFDMLDTMKGQNLSLQVHPLTGYIQDKFGMHYTQDESYYILDCGPDCYVYLGIQDGADPAEMISALREAQKGGGFQAEKYVNKIPVRKHDHFSIPAGTVHCSGTDTMVLEISATPYIFTFKLWDWDRLGLDGKPRPVHLDHGEANIRFDRRTDWTNETKNPVETAKGEGWIEERTGLHALQFIETRRRRFSQKTYHNTEGNLHVLNLVEGSEAVVESPSGAFAPFTVHYAETFIVPAQVGEYTIAPALDDGKECATIQAFVRF